MQFSRIPWLLTRRSYASLTNCSSLLFFFIRRPGCLMEKPLTNVSQEVQIMTKRLKVTRLRRLRQNARLIASWGARMSHDVKAAIMSQKKNSRTKEARPEDFVADLSRIYMTVHFDRGICLFIEITFVSSSKNILGCYFILKAKTCLHVDGNLKIMAQFCCQRL